MKENPKTDNVFKKKYYFYTTIQNKCGRLYFSIRGKADFSQESVSEFSDVLNFQVILALKVFFWVIIKRFPFSFQLLDVYVMHNYLHIFMDNLTALNMQESQTISTVCEIKYNWFQQETASSAWSFL